MNTLNTPGFTAGASLYQMRGSYRSLAVGSNIGGEQRVVAQRISRDGGCYAGLSRCWGDCNVWPHGTLRYYCQDGCLTTFDACTR